MGVDHREPLEEPLAHDLHEPRRHDQVRRVGTDRLGEGGVPVVAVGMVADPHDERGDARPSGPFETFDALTVRADGHHGGAVRRIGARVEQRLKVGAGP